MRKCIAVLLCLLFSFPCISFADEASVKIISTTPQDGATEISPVELQMEVTFSSDMDASTLKAGNITIYPNLEKEIRINESNKRKITIIFGRASLGTKYTLTFLKGIKSVDGIALTKTNISFTTITEAPQYRQISYGDMEDAVGMMLNYNDADNNLHFSQVKEGGNNVLKLDLSWDDAPILQKAYCMPGKTYNVRSKVKSSIQQDIWYVLDYTTPTNSDWYHKVGQIQINANEWTDLVGSYTVPADANLSMNIRIIAHNRGSSVWVDNLQFYEDGFDVPPPNNKSGTVQKKILNTFVSDEKDENASMLKAFEIDVNKEFTNTEELVSRDKLAEYAAKLMRCENNINTNAGIKYSDIDSTSYNGFAGVVSALEIMNGYPDNTFRPNDNVLFGEAVSVIVNVLGYKYRAQTHGYLITAAEIGILKKIENIHENDYISYKVLNQLIVNALETKVVRIDVFKPNEESDFSQQDITLENELNIYKNKGIIEATEDTSLNNYKGIAKNKVKINGEEFNVYSDVTGLIGQKVNYYTKEIDGETVILYICSLENYNSIIIIDAENITGYSDGIYKYNDDNDRIQEIKLSKDKYLIYNGRSLSDYEEDKMLFDYGNLTFVDNNNDGYYEIVKITAYDTYVVQAIDIEESIIYDKFENKSIKINIDDNLKCIKGGKTVKFSVLKEGDVLSIAQSEDGGFARIIISNEIFSGNIAEVEHDGKANTLVFYDKVHGKDLSQKNKLIPNYNDLNKLTVGAQGVFYLDFNGRVAAYRKYITNFQFGYLVKTGMNNLKSEMTLKLFTVNNEFEFLKCDEHVKINGDKYKNAASAEEAINENSAQAVTQLIQYKQNESGIITEIRTLNNNDKNGFREVLKGVGLMFKTGDKTLGKQIAVDNDVSIFSIPDDPANADEEQFQYGNYYYLVGEKNYDFTAYSVSDTDLVANALVVTNKPISNVDYWMGGVVEKIANVLKNDEPAIEITIRNSVTTYTTRVDEASELENLTGADGRSGLKLEKGDIIVWQNNRMGKIFNAIILFDVSNMELTSATNPNTNEFNTAYRMLFGQISDRFTTYAKMKLIGNDVGKDEVHDMSQYTNILEFDRNRGKLSKISYTDVYDSMRCTGNGSYAVVMSIWQEYTLMIIYK